MKRVTPVFIFLILLVILTGFIGLYEYKNKSKINNKAPIKVGLLLPLTGPVASLGEAMRQGYEWKISQLIEQGVDISFVIEDSRSNPKDALTAFNKLVTIDEVQSVFTTMSAVGMAIKPIAEEKKILFWVDAAHPDLTKNSQFILRHSNTSSGDAEILGQKVLDLQKKKVAVFFQNDDWGVVASRLLMEKLEKNAVAVIGEAIDNKSSDFRQQIIKIKSQNVDGLVSIVAGPAAGLLIKQSRELGFLGDIISSVGIVLTPDAQKVAGEHLTGTYYQTYKENGSFSADYMKEFGTSPPLFSRVAYTDIELLVSAIQKTKSTDSDVLVQYIKNLGQFHGTYEDVKINTDGDIIVETVVKQW